MDIKKLQSIVIDALEDVKAQDIRVFDTSLQTSLFDRVTIASGTSNRQTKALASSVREKVKEKGGNVISVEGEETGEWVLVDLGDMIVHIMQPAIRDYYRLEELWGEKEVKFGAAKRTASTASAKRASETEEKVPAPRRSRIPAVAVTQALDDDDAPKKVVRKPRATTAKPTTKTPVGKTVRVAAPRSAAAPKKTAAKSSAGTAKKAPAKRVPRAAAKSKTA
jgi:ribosome-associated protein